MIYKEYKSIFKSFLVIALVLAVVLPNISLAKFGENKPEKPSSGEQKGIGQKQQEDSNSPKIGGANFCLQLDKLSQNQLRLTEKQTKMAENKKERETKLASRYQDREQRQDENREKWDANRQEHFDALMKLADTDAKKQAVAQFQKAVSAAISARREAFDAAKDAFRLGVDNLWKSKQAEADKTVNSLNARIQAAVAKAKEGCAVATPDNVALRNAFQVEIKAAQEAFKNEKNSIDKMKDQIKVLNDAKKQATEKALADFKAVTEKARTDLKAVLQPVVTTVPTTSPAQ